MTFNVELADHLSLFGSRIEWNSVDCRYWPVCARGGRGSCFFVRTIRVDIRV